MFTPHRAFMCSVWISEQIASISLHNIKWPVCITETVCVYCAVRILSLQFWLAIFKLNCLLLNQRNMKNICEIDLYVQK